MDVYAADLFSADSLAWSYAGRRTAGCTSTHKNEANCPRYATEWRTRLLANLSAWCQPSLFAAGA